MESCCFPTGLGMSIWRRKLGASLRTGLWPRRAAELGNVFSSLVSCPRMGSARGLPPPLRPASPEDMRVCKSTFPTVSPACARPESGPRRPALLPDASPWHGRAACPLQTSRRLTNGLFLAGSPPSSGFVGGSWQ